MLQQNEITKLYDIRFKESNLKRKNKIWIILCRCFFQKWIKASDTVVDLACGHGEFINHIHAHRKIGIDLNPESIRFLHANVEHHFGLAQNISNVILANSTDIVFTSNFLEHLHNKQELSLLLDQVFATLKPGGKFMILGPNLRYLPGKYWDFYDHHLGLTHLSLCEVLAIKGFRIETCMDKFIPYTTQSHIPQYPWLVWLYLKLPFFLAFFWQTILCSRSEAIIVPYMFLIVLCTFPGFCGSPGA